MTIRTPPRLARELLERLGSNNHALAGDLAEAFRGGRSGWWYWRQVLGAIALDAVREIGTHKMVTIRAIALGQTFVWVSGRYLMYDILHYDQWLFARGIAKWFYVNGYGLPPWAGWPAIAILFAASGWIVGRTHRQYGPSIVFAYALFVTFAVFATGAWRLAHDPASADPIYAILDVTVRQTLVCPVPALIGGLMGLDTKRLSDKQMRA